MKAQEVIDRFFTGISDALGTNYTIILFIIIAVVPLYFQKPHTIIEWQSWVSQTMIQLVALAVLQKGTRIQGMRSDQLQKEIHDNVMNQVDMIKENLNSAAEERRLLNEIIIGIKEDFEADREESILINDMIKDIHSIQRKLDCEEEVILN